MRSGVDVDGPRVATILVRRSTGMGILSRKKQRKRYGTTRCERAGIMNATYPDQACPHRENRHRTRLVQGKHFRASRGRGHRPRRESRYSRRADRLRAHGRWRRGHGRGGARRRFGRSAHADRERCAGPQGRRGLGHAGGRHGRHRNGRRFRPGADRAGAPRSDARQQPRRGRADPGRARRRRAPHHPGPGRLRHQRRRRRHADRAGRAAAGRRRTQPAARRRALARIASIDIHGLDPRLAGARIDVASDVDNPLCGPQGASHVFGPQKGATPAQVHELDQALERFADICARSLGSTIAMRPARAPRAAWASRPRHSWTRAFAPAWTSWPSWADWRKPWKAPRWCSPAKAGWMRRRCAARRRPASPGSPGRQACPWWPWPARWAKATRPCTPAASARRSASRPITLQQALNDAERLLHDRARDVMQLWMAAQKRML